VNKTVGKHSGKAEPRASGRPAGGRYADDLVNAISAHTGLTFTPLSNPDGAHAFAVIEQATTQGMQVPVVIGAPARNAAQAHYVLIQGRRVTNGVIEYSLHDPADGTTKWILATDVKNGTIPGVWHKIGTIEVPTRKAPPVPDEHMSPAAHGAADNGKARAGSKEPDEQVAAKSDPGHVGEDEKTAGSKTRSGGRSSEQHVDGKAGPQGGRYGSLTDGLDALLDDPHPTPKVREIQEEARRIHPTDRDRQRQWAKINLQDVRRDLVASRRDIDIPRVLKTLHDAGMTHVSEKLVRDMFNYLFDSSGLGFYYPNYQGWVALAEGRPRIDDIRFFIHESTEIGLMRADKVDFLGRRYSIGSDKHEEWYSKQFEPAYMKAHSKALYVEYEYLQRQLEAIVGTSKGLTPEMIAGFDPVNTQAIEYIELPDGRKITDPAALHAFKAAGDQIVHIDPKIAARLGVNPDVKLAELLRAVRESPAALDKSTSHGRSGAPTQPPKSSAPGAVNKSSAQEGLDALNSQGSYDYRIEKVKQIREDILTGSRKAISPEVTDEAIERMKQHIHNLSDEELAAIQGYSSQDYEKINPVLRNPNADPAMTAKLQGYVDAVRSGLEKLPPYEGEAYRGTSMSQGTWKKWEDAYRNGSPISDAAFSSSSASEEVAEEFLARGRDPAKVPVFARIQSRTGKEIEFLSKTASEAEVLFSTDTEFQIIAIDDVVGPDGQMRKEVFLKEIVRKKSSP
jgi:hypothetical protein